MTQDPSGTAVQPSDLRSRLLAAIQNPEHEAILFRNLDDVPVGSTGYLSPSGRSVARGPYGWTSHDVSYTPQDNQVFTSHHGPANDEKLAELLEASLVPENAILVSFEAVTGTESDWELGYSSTYTDLADPKLLSHNLDNTALAHLYFQIEAVGGLGESDAYGDLDKLIQQLGEGPAEALRAQADTAHPALFELDAD
ncbi:hypothetical protein [Pseudarthrobacter sp. GA104]|uniref:hypothetical protein n=1 Tax=Pseudarthrobacter sp. GA104 TaxID=2676311 RepID=UPI0012F79D08|nr:hypothetical protein [Pseudarthrobacter sp. GA104]MUU73450.1 hypothetical protein [Pseudarthrobacter sp. GA104]